MTPWNHPVVQNEQKPGLGAALASPWTQILRSSRWKWRCSDSLVGPWTVHGIIVGLPARFLFAKAQGAVGATIF